MSFDSNKVGEALRKHREEKGVTLRGAARELRTYPSNLHRYESGTVIPSLPLLWALADYYCISLDELVGHREKPSGKPDVAEWLREARP